MSLWYFIFSTAATASETGWIITVDDPVPGKTIRSLQGVNAGPYPSGDVGNADLTIPYQQIGVNLVRTHDFYGPLDMAVMYPDRTADPALPTSYNFTESDIRFQAILNCGSEPYFRLGDSYNNVNPPTSSELANWIQASVNVIRHYRQGLWNGFHSSFRYIEIGNEPDNEWFWPKPLTLMDYFKLYVQTATALRTAFPECKLGGPGWTHNIALTSDGQEIARQFLDYVMEHGAPLDFVSWHIYSNTPEDFRDSARFYRDLLDETGLNTVESHNTEWNTDTNIAPEEAVELRVNAKGAALASASWIEMQNNQTDISTFFRGNDTSMDLPTFYGLFMADGTPKKMADTFYLWSELCGYSDKVAVSGKADSSSPQLYMLSGQKNARDHAILLVNPTDSDTTYSLKFSGRGSSYREMSNVSVLQVNDNASGIIQFPGTVTNNPISKRTVQLVKFTIRLKLLRNCSEISGCR